MKKFLFLVLAISLAISCQSKRHEKIEKFMVDGVEVVVNHLKPYKLKGEPTTLRLEEAFAIDTEKDEIAETGLIDIETFNVDSEGQIYLLRRTSNENFVFKFDRDGNFLKSFCSKGQGPGELEWGGLIRIDENDEIIVKDPSKREFLVFNTDGDLIKEVRLNRSFSPERHLPTGKYLISWQEVGSRDEYLHNCIGLYDSEFNEVKELDRITFPNPSSRLPKSVRGIRHTFRCCVSKENIFIANEKRSYEILVFDFKGNLTRKIKKDYTPVDVPQILKRSHSKPYLDSFHERVSKSFYFPKHMPPFQYIFADDAGRLFVMTYERGEKPREYIYDIFNPGGIFIGRISLGNIRRLYYKDLLVQEEPKEVISKKNYLYCLIEIESGYKELVVYKMKWE